MKKIFCVLFFTSVSMFSKVPTHDDFENNCQEIIAIAECCTVTLEDESGSTTVTVRSCATTLREACRDAYDKAERALGIEP